MTVYEIPTSTQNSHYTQTVELSEALYQLELRYNTRMQRWILTVRNAAGQIVVAGIPMLTLRRLTDQYTTLAVPPGTLFCYSETNPNAEPTLSSFLLDTGFYYRDPE